MLKHATWPRRPEAIAETGALTETYRINAVERAVDVLEALGAARLDLRLSDIAVATGLHPTTALRFLAILSRRGLVARHPETGRYSLGFGLVALAEVAKSRCGLIERCLPEMRRLRDRLNETVLLSVRDTDWRIDLEQLVGLQENRLVVAVGARKLLYVGAASKLLLAAMKDDAIDSYLARTPLLARGEHTIIDPADLRAAIARIRARGYAESLAEGPSRGAAIAAPVVDRDGTVASLSVFLPHYRYGRVARRGIVDAVCAAAAAVSDMPWPEPARGKGGGNVERG